MRSSPTSAREIASWPTMRGSWAILERLLEPVGADVRAANHDSDLAACEAILFGEQSSNCYARRTFEQHVMRFDEQPHRRFDRVLVDVDEAIDDAAAELERDRAGFDAPVRAVGQRSDVLG